MSPKHDYVSAICKEIELRKNYISNETVQTIYFGGGTPSQLSYEDFLKIFDAIYAGFNVVSDVEITMEANPDDLNGKYPETLRKLPFNRLSIGIQSFDDDELKFLKRRHSAERAIEAVRICKSLGYDNISIDLMYGLPNQTMDIWHRNLDRAIALDIHHISSYHLVYEQETRLFRLFERGDIKPVDEDLSVEMFSAMIDRLGDAGFEHYEISAFAKNGLYSRHNSSYWLGAKYLGLGPAAHSFDGQNRAWNIASTPQYIEGISLGIPAIEIEYPDKNTGYNDFILTGMRTVWGVNLGELEKRFGASMKDYCTKTVQKHIDRGFVTNTDNVLRLTRKGVFISDGIMSDLMRVE
jgi:oxygen-independent coproporphyrinogen-3 oxidase